MDLACCPYNSKLLQRFAILVDAHDQWDGCVLSTGGFYYPHSLIPGWLSPPRPLSVPMAFTTDWLASSSTPPCSTMDRALNRLDEPIGHLIRHYFLATGSVTKKWLSTRPDGPNQLRAQHLFDAQCWREDQITDNVRLCFCITFAILLPFCRIRGFPTNLVLRLTCYNQPTTLDVANNVTVAFSWKRGRNPAIATLLHIIEPCL